MSDKLLTFNTLLENGYTYPDNIDEVTAEMISDWFRFRLTGDHFTEYFNRTLKLNYPYYRQLLRVDPTVTSYDWFVDNYRERQTVTDETATNTGSSSQTHNSTDNHTTTGSGSINNNSTSQGSENTTTTYDTEENDTGTQADNVRNTAFNRQTPMSAEYNAGSMRSGSTLTAGHKSISGHTENIPFPSILNPTATSDSLNEQSSAIDNTHEKTGTDTVAGSSSRTDESSTSSTNNIETSGTNTDTIQGSKSDTNSIDRVIREIATGRNENISSLLSQAIAVIKNSRAWDFLYNELNKCFIQSYNFED